MSQVITTRSANSFTYRLPDMRGLKKTQIAGVVLMRVREASCSCANLSTDTPPARCGPGVFGGGAKLIEPLSPMESEFQVLPENGNEKLVKDCCGSVASLPNSASHCKVKFSAR